MRLPSKTYQIRYSIDRNYITHYKIPARMVLFAKATDKIATENEVSIETKGEFLFSFTMKKGDVDKK